MTASLDLLIQRDHFALVLIDIQDRLAAVMDRRDLVIGNAIRLTKLASLLEAPIIVTRQYPLGLGDSAPELETVLASLPERPVGVTRLDKTAFCCCFEPDFLAAVTALGREQLVLAGMETHICVAQTALALADEGYRVQVAADACCSRTIESHHLALARMRQVGVMVTVSESVMYEAVGQAGTDEFRQLLAIVKRDS